MWTIGIETSGREGTVALLREEKLVTERSLSHEGRRHARTLVHELQQMLAEANVAPRACDLLAVSVGPGSFTGLRVGVVCAKTWAYATGCRLVAVDTLHAIAASAEDSVDRVDVVSDAQRGDLFLGRFCRDDQRAWMSEADTQIISTDEWLKQLTMERSVTGPAIEKLKERIQQSVCILPESTWHPSARTVARVGHTMAQAGQTVDHWSLVPLYLRKSAAEEKAEVAAHSGTK